VRVLITGADGQLGRELKRSSPEWAVVRALTKEQLDIVDQAQIEFRLREFQPDIIINAAAYTAVDLAEREPERAYAVNALAPQNLARAAAAANLRLIHLSTDFIFSGSQPTPYLPSDSPGPLSVYGASKLEGERAVLKILDDRALIVRTSWVYSVYGRNFVKTIIDLSKNRSTLQVVTDQIGSPTWARGLAEVLWEMAGNADLRGVYHWTDAGVASWYDLAVAVVEYGSPLGLINRPVTIRPIASSDYPTAAKRPAMSLLDKTATWNALKCNSVHWRQALKEMLSQLVGQTSGS
jgi:dTDP-4-dehydrorhamnose reductase